MVQLTGNVASTRSNLSSTRKILVCIFYLHVSKAIQVWLCSHSTHEYKLVFACN